MRIKALVLAMSLVMTAAAVCWADGTIWYVKPGAPYGGSGLAWASAKASIEAAVAAAGAYDEIWVAQGTYYPTATISLKAGQELYGGFMGHELNRLARAAEFYPSLDIKAFSDTAFQGAGNNVFDGFNVVDRSTTDHYMSAGFLRTVGGRAAIANCTFDVWMLGVRVISSTDTLLNVTNCTFNCKDALHLSRGVLRIEYCDFAGPIEVNSGSVNASNSRFGHLFCIWNGEQVEFKDCGFFRECLDSGECLLIHASDNIVLSSCWFSGSCAAVRIWDSGLLTIDNCYFANNSGYPGLSLSSYEYTSIPSFQFSIRKSTFVNNQDGAILILNAVGSIEDCTFSGNASSGGGAVYVSESWLTFENCLFTDNHSDGSGSALRFDGPGETSLTNCTFSGNTAAYGGALCTHYDARVQISNSVLWDNVPSALAIEGFSAKIAVEHSCIEGGAPGTGNIVVDPMFVDPAGGDFSLSYFSPCIDIASADGAPDADIAGVPRPQLNGFDMGAYEYIVPDEDADGMDDNWEDYYDLDPTDPDDADDDPDGDGVTNLQESVIRTNPQDLDDCRDTYYVSPAGSDTEGDGSETTPWATIGKAMAYAGGFSMYKPVTIYAAAGTYVEPVVLAEGISLIGDGPSATKIQYFNVSDDEHNVVVGADNASLEDCTVRVTGQYSASFSLLKLDDVSMDITNVTFDGDDNLYSLGALIVGTGSSDTVIDGCTFRRLYFGVQAVNTSANVTNTTFSGIRGDAIFVRLPDVKKYGEVVNTPVLGDATLADTTGNNTFRTVMGNFVLNMNTSTTKAENNDWGVYSEAEIAAKMAGPVDYKPYVGEQADVDNGGCFSADTKTAPWRTTRGNADTFMMFGIASCLAIGYKRRK